MLRMKTQSDEIILLYHFDYTMIMRYSAVEADEGREDKINEGVFQLRKSSFTQANHKKSVNPLFRVLILSSDVSVTLDNIIIMFMIYS